MAVGRPGLSKSQCKGKRLCKLKKACFGAVDINSDLSEESSQVLFEFSGREEGKERGHHVFMNFSIPIVVKIQKGIKSG